MRLLPFDTALGSHLDARAGEKEPIKLVFGSLEHIDQDWEVLAESTQSEHVITRIPLAVGD